MPATTRLLRRARAQGCSRLPTQAYSALLFNNCLDNGEPDERTQHEGIVPAAQTKFAINGWMRAKHLGGAGMRDRESGGGY